MTSISLGNLSSSGVNFSNKKILILAKRGAGKSWLCREIIKHISSPLICNMIIISPTEKLDKFYGNKFDCEIEDDLKNLDYLIKNRLSKNSLLVIDDAIPLSKITDNCECLTYMNQCMNDLTLIVTMQCPIYEKDLIESFDYVLIGKEDFIVNIKKFYYTIPTKFESFSEFANVIKKLPDYHFLMLDINKEMEKNDDISCARNTDILITKLNIYNILKIDQIAKDHILIINNDINNNIKITKNLIYESENSIDEVIIINAVGINNYKENISKIYKPDSSILKQVFKNHQKNKIVIIEYCLSKLRKDQNFIELVYTARHYNIKLIIVEKFPQTISPDIGMNFDKYIIGKYSEKPVLQKLYDNYFGILPAYNNFRQLMEYIDDNKYLMINNKSGNSIYDKLMFFVINDEYVPSKIYNNEIYDNKFIDANNSINIENNSNIEIILKHLDMVNTKLDNLERKINRNN